MINIIKSIIILLLGIPVSVLVNYIVGYPNNWVIDSNSAFGIEIIWLCFCIANIGHIYEIFTNKQRNIIFIIGVIWLIISPFLIGPPPWQTKMEQKYGGGNYAERWHQYKIEYFKVLIMFMISITGAYLLSIYKIRIVKQLTRMGN